MSVHCNWSIFDDFSLWEINKMRFPWVELYLPSVTPSYNLVQVFLQPWLILRISGAWAQIAMSSANSERFTCASREWGMSLTYKINRIGERGLPWGTPWMGVIGSLSWSLIEIISFLWKRKLLIHLINFLFRPIAVKEKATIPYLVEGFLDIKKYSCSWVTLTETKFNYFKKKNI